MDSQGISVLQKVISSIKTYKSLLAEQGYSNSEVNALLLSLLEPAGSSKQDSIVSQDMELMNLIKFYLDKHPSISEALTQLLVNIQVEITLLKEASDQEEITQTQSSKISPDRIKEGKKKQEKKKKKSKSNKNKAIDEVKAKALFQMERQREGLKQNMEQIKLLKNFLDNKIMGQMFFKPVPSIHPSSIFSL